MHAANVDGIGYAFPYDDVTPDGGPDQSGKVESGNPTLFTVTVGGGQYASVQKHIAASTGAAKPVGAVSTTGRMMEPEAGAAQKPEAAQKPIGVPETQGEEAAKKQAEKASKGPTATPVDTPPAPGPGVAPHPKKPSFFKRVLGRLMCWK